MKREFKWEKCKGGGRQLQGFKKELVRIQTKYKDN